MTNQNLQSSVNIPEIWEEKYFIHLVGKLEPILITKSEYEGVLKSLEAGGKHVKIRHYLIMLNSIVVITPRYEPYNIPPKPKPQYDFDGDQSYCKNQKEIDHWQNLFNKKLISDYL